MAALEKDFKAIATKSGVPIEDIVRTVVAMTANETLWMTSSQFKLTHTAGLTVSKSGATASASTNPWLDTCRTDVPGVVVSQSWFTGQEKKFDTWYPVMQDDNKGALLLALYLVTDFSYKPKVIEAFNATKVKSPFNIIAKHAGGERLIKNMLRWNSGDMLNYGGDVAWIAKQIIVNEQ